MDAFDAFTYLLGFWAYMLSSGFRARVHARWRERRGWARAETWLEIGVSTAFGLVLPVAVLVYNLT